MAYSRYEQSVMTFTRWVLAHRWLVVLSTLALALAIASGARYIGFSNDYRVFFSHDNPQLMAFETFQLVFSKNDNIVMVVQPKEGDVFQPRTLRLIQSLTEKSWKIPYSTKVDSIANFQHTYAEEDDLTVIDLYEQDPASYSQKELDWRKQVALSDPLITKRLIAQDGKTTGINIIIQVPGKSSEEVTEATLYARALIAEAQQEYPDHIFALSGATVMSHNFSESAMKDMATLVPIMYAVLIGGMFVFLRSGFGTFASVMVILLATMTGMGMAGWLGIALTPPSATAPTVILTLAIADSVHLLISITKEMRKGRSKDEAILESMRINFSPVFLTSLTTVIGFLSLNSSDAPPFHDLGNITAIGVAAAWFYSITFFPALISLLPVKVRVMKESKKSHFTAYAEWLTTHYKAAFAGSVIVAVFLILGLFRLELNDEFVKYFSEEVPFRKDTEFMMKHLTGIYAIEYHIPAQGSQGVNDPEFLKVVEDFSNWARAREGVIHVFSFTDIMKRLNKNMHGDDPAYYAIPENQNLAAQYLLLYELSLPFGLDLTDRINVDKSATRVTLTTRELSTVETRQLEAESLEWVKQHAPAYMQDVKVTGPIIMFSYISERNIHSMIQGNIIAFLLISLSIGFALSSTRLGIISIIPNIIPALLAFGSWGYLMGQVNMAVATVSAVSLGIIVDDTIHLMSKYQRGRREKGLDTRDSIIYALNMTGVPLVVTTVVLVAGFSILALSTFEINSSMGLLTALTIGIALVMDFVLLPSLLMLVDRKTHTKIPPKKSSQKKSSVTPKKRLA